MEVKLNLVAFTQRPVDLAAIGDIKPGVVPHLEPDGGENVGQQTDGDVDLLNQVQ
jgi:hypothetical protein